MTIQDLGSIGEVVGAIATVASLIYLAVQVRASNRLARAEASRSPNSDLNSLNAAFGTDPTFRAAFRLVLGVQVVTNWSPNSAQLSTCIWFQPLTFRNSSRERFEKAFSTQMRSTSEAPDYSCFPTIGPVGRSIASI